MTADPTSTSRPSRVAVTILGVMAVLAMLVPAMARNIHATGQPLFWDAHVYALAIHAFQEGKDPYANTEALTFIYPPVFLMCADWCSRLLHGNLAWNAYLISNLLALLAVPFILSEGYFRARWFSASVAVCIFLFHPPFTAAYALKTGNIANILYALLLAAALPGLRRKRWLGFYFAVAVSASIKLPMLSFLVLPLLLGEQQALASIVTACVVFALNAVQKLAEPTAYQAYLQAVRYQMLNHDSVGLGVFATVFHMVQRSTLLPKATPLVVHFLLCGALAAGMYWARTRGTFRDLPQWSTSLTILLALLLNPRMVTYDLVMLVVPMVFLVGEMLLALFSSTVSACLMLGLLGCWFGLGRLSIAACYLVSLACFPLAACFWYKSCTRDSAEDYRGSGVLLPA